MASVFTVKLTVAPIVPLVVVSLALGTLSPPHTSVRSHIARVLVRGEAYMFDYFLKSLGVFAERQH